MNPDEWARLCKTLGLDPEDDASLKNPEAKRAALRRLKAATNSFPNYGIPRQVALLREPWSIDNGLLTPTLKIKRNVIRQRYSDEIEALYDIVMKAPSEV